VKINTLGQFLQFYREKYNFQQDKVCSGICSLATLSRVENGSKIVDSLVAESLLGRIGKEVLQFELLLNDNDYHLWIMRQEIQKQMNLENYREVETLLAEYRKEMPQKEAVHEQFCLYHEALLKMHKKTSTEEICALLYRALRLTKPEFDGGDEEKLLYNPMEIELITKLIHHGYSGWEDRDREKELLRLFDFVERIYSGRQKERTGTEILMELVMWELQAEKYAKVIAHVDKAVNFISQGRGIENIAELHFIKAQALERLYHRMPEWVEQERICKEECLMAYYVFDILGQMEEKQEVKQFCEDKLGWQIIE